MNPAKPFPICRDTGAQGIAGGFGGGKMKKNDAKSRSYSYTTDIIAVTIIYFFGKGLDK